MTLLYIFDEHPSTSQTFVVNEAAALRELGVDVLGYALKRGSAMQPAAEVALLRTAPTTGALALAVAASLPNILVALWRLRSARPGRREIPRLALAVAHARYIRGACRRHRVTHIHAHFLGRCSDVASELAGRLRCQWTATAHGEDAYAPPEPALMRERLRRVSGVVCANRRVRACLEDLAAPAALRSEVIHCGVDTRTLRPRSNVDRTRSPHFVTVGRLVATKGHWTILESAAWLMRRHETLRWSIVGDGPLRERLKQDPRCRELAPRLTFLGALDHTATLELVADATVFVLPCEAGERGPSDGIPVAIMEAMALGVVVVTTATGGIAELVVPDENGFLVPPSDAPRLAATLEQIAYSAPPGSLNRVTDAARKTVERDFDLHGEAAKLIAFLEPYGVCSGV